MSSWRGAGVGQRHEPGGVPGGVLVEQFCATKREVCSRQPQHARNPLTIAQLVQTQHARHGYGPPTAVVVARIGDPRHRCAARVLEKVAAKVEEELGGGIAAGCGAADRQLGVGEGQAQLEAVRSAWKKRRSGQKSVRDSYSYEARVLTVCKAHVNKWSWFLLTQYIEQQLL